MAKWKLLKDIPNNFNGAIALGKFNSAKELEIVNAVFYHNELSTYYKKYFGVDNETYYYELPLQLE